MPRYWVGVALLKNHVLRGVEGNSLSQVCHMERVLLNRMEKGDYLFLYYSPNTYEWSRQLQCRGRGKITDDKAYQV